MPLKNFPETTRMNATRSRWFGSMFAWILNTNPENSGFVGSTISFVDSCGDGAGARSRNSSRNGSTPKFVSALPKNTGESSPVSSAS